MTKFKRLVDNAKCKAHSVLSKNDYVYIPLLSFLSEKSLLKWTENITSAPSEWFDKAMDQNYLNGSSGGGGNHRLFDGGHDLLGAWQKVSDARPEDTLTQEVIGYVTGLLKDVTTTKGLPFATLDKTNYEVCADAFSTYVPCFKREWLYDLCSYDAMEIVSSSLGIVGAALALQTTDKKRLAEILGAMGITSIVAANPLLGLVTIASAAYSYKKAMLNNSGKSALIGASSAALSTTLFMALGLPILLEIVVVLLATNLLKKHVLKNEELHLLIMESIRGSGTEMKKEIEKIIITHFPVSGAKQKKAV